MNSDFATLISSDSHSLVVVQHTLATTRPGSRSHQATIKNLVMSSYIITTVTQCLSLPYIHLYLGARPDSYQCHRPTQERSQWTVTCQNVCSASSGSLLHLQPTGLEKLSSDPLSPYELSTISPWSVGGSSSTDSMTSEKIDTHFISPEGRSCWRICRKCVLRPNRRKPPNSRTTRKAEKILKAAAIPVKQPSCSLCSCSAVA